MPVIPLWLRQLSWQAVLVALVSGGIIHIVATLVIPQFATAGGVKRLAGTLPANRMQVLPQTSAENQPVPFVGPDVRLAVCRYDVTDGPVNVSAMLPDRFLYSSSSRCSKSAISKLLLTRASGLRSS